MVADKFPIKSEIMYVPMRDGVELCAYIRRPDADGEFPAIVQYTPYRWFALVEPDPIIAHGYATVDFDVRGTGNSEGWNEAMYSAVERQDGYDMIEWAAGQPWCNGSVGMWGLSYGAVVCLQMAKAAPPSLKAIIARSGTDDPYIEWTNPGGAVRKYMYECYSPLMTASNFSPPDPDIAGERWAEMWTERLEKNVPWGLSYIQNLVDGPFWRERSLRGQYDQVQCAVYVVGGWADWYATPLLRVFENLEGPKKALIGPWSHQWPGAATPEPRLDWTREALKWFDYWLKDINTGVMDVPPVTLFVREYSQPATLLLEDRGAFRSENEWPIERTEPRPLYFGPEGLLSAALSSQETQNDDNACDVLEYNPLVGINAGLHGGGPFSPNWAMPLDQRMDEIHSLTYTTPPLEEDLEVTGRPRAVLHFSSTAEVMLFTAKLCDVAPDGTSAQVTKGYLNVTHRESHTEPSYIQPGEVYEIEVDLLACAYRFQKGHRIRVDIANADFLNLWPTPQFGTNTIYRDAARPSRIILPVVPPQPVPLPEPDLRPSPLPKLPLEPPHFTITQDLIQDTQTLAFERRFWTFPQTAVSTVWAKDPARSVVQSGARYQYDYQGREIVVDAQTITSSDANAFHHTVEVEITFSGKQHFNKSWSVSVPRPFV